MAGPTHQKYDEPSEEEARAYLRLTNLARGNTPKAPQVPEFNEDARAYARLASAAQRNLYSHVAGRTAAPAAQYGYEYDEDGLLRIAPGFEYDEVTGFVLPTTETAVADAKNSFKGFGKSLESGIVQGADIAASGITASLDWLLGEPLAALGWERNWFSLLNDYYQGVKKNNATYYDAVLADSGEISRGTRKILTMVTSSLPQAVLAVVTAGGSAAGELASAMPSAANAIVTMVRNPMFWSSFASTAGNSYYAARDSGAGDLEASLCALASGIACATVEVGGGLEKLPLQLRQGETALRAWIRSMLDEGKEEVVQGVIERAAQNVTSSAPAPIFSLSNERAPLNPLSAVRDYLSGVTVSSVLGGGQVAANSFLSGGSNTAANAPASADNLIESGWNTDKPLPELSGEEYNGIIEDAIADGNRQAEVEEGQGGDGEEIASDQASNSEKNTVPDTYVPPKGGGGITDFITVNGQNYIFGHGGRHLEGTGLSVSNINR